MVMDGKIAKTLASTRECVVHLERSGWDTVIHNWQERNVQVHPLHIVSAYGGCKRVLHRERERE